MKDFKKNPLFVFLILFFLLFVVISFYFTKNHFSKKSNKNETAAEKDAGAQENSEEKPEVLLATPEEAHAAIRKNNYILLDIRSEEKFESFHIESSQSYPYQEISKNNPSLDAGKTVIIIEETPSKRGIEIARNLIKENYEVRCLEGGLKKYIEEGYNVISSGNFFSNLDAAKADEITKEEILTKLNNGENIVFLDVRKKEAFKKNHIKNSVNIPLEELENRKSEIPLGNVIIVDENPERSFKAAVMLFDMNILTAYYFPDNFRKLRSSPEQ
jgi:rhodanese-related sulfurtransferase